MTKYISALIIIFIFSGCFARNIATLPLRAAGSVIKHTNPVRIAPVRVVPRPYIRRY